MGNGGACRRFFVFRKITDCEAGCLRGCSPRRWRFSSSRFRCRSFSRHTELIPSYIWTEEMALLFHLVDPPRRDGRHPRGHAFRRRPVAAAQRARKPRSGLVASVFVLVFAFVFLWWGIDFTASPSTASPSSPSCRSGTSIALADCRRHLDSPRRADVGRRARVAGKAPRPPPARRRVPGSIT